MSRLSQNPLTIYHFKVIARITLASVQSFLQNVSGKLQMQKRGKMRIWIVQNWLKNTDPIYPGF